MHLKNLSLFLLIACSVVSGCSADEKELSFSALEKESEYVLELITKRELSDAEIERATREYISTFDNQCLERCVEITQMNRDRVEPMASAPGSPRDLLARQYYSRSLYFSPTQAGSFIQSLTDEVDPIVLADAKSQRIMTRADIIAVIQIRHFVENGGSPAKKAYSEADIANETARYHAHFVDGALKLPFQAGLAAELWAGLRQNWRQFNAAEKDQLRQFLASGAGLSSMDADVLQRLWGITEAEAVAWKQYFVSEHQLARLEYLGYISMMGAVARATNVGEAFWRW